MGKPRPKSGGLGEAFLNWSCMVWGVGVGSRGPPGQAWVPYCSLGVAPLSIVPHGSGVCSLEVPWFSICLCG